MRPSLDRRAGDLYRRYHVVVWWVLLVQTVFAIWFTLLVPIYRGPDEALHVDMVRRYQSVRGYPDPIEFTDVDPAVVASTWIVDRGGARPRPPLRLEDATPRPERLPFDELPTTDDPVRNQLSQHPPLYYGVTAGVTSTLGSIVPESVWSWDREVLFLRLGSVVILGLVPLFAAESMRALGLPREVGGLAAALALWIPGLTVLRALVNNDVLAVAFASAAIAASLHCLRRPTPRVVMLAAGCAGAGLLTKSTAAPVAVWASIVIVASVIAHAERPAGAVIRRLAAIGAVLVIGASWHLTQVARYGDPQPSGVQRGTRAEGSSPSVLEFAEKWTDPVVSSFFGEPGRKTGVTLASWQILALGSVFVVLILVGATSAVRGRRLPALALTGLFAFQLVNMLRPNWKSYVVSGTAAGLQGRYLYPCLVAIVALVALGAWRLMRSRSTAVHDLVARIALVVGVGLHLFLVWSALRGYWADGGRGVPGALESLTAWSPLPWVVTAGLGLAGAAVVAVAMGGQVLAVMPRRTRSSGAQ